MDITQKLAAKILQGLVLDQADIKMMCDLEVDQKTLLLGMLQAKGFGADQVQVWLDFFQAQAPSLICRGAIDVCGTGGSGLPRINTSTLSAFILGSLGVQVAKHGNRAGAGRFGSFDFLESLGINIDPGVENLQYLYGQSGLAFILAPKFYPLVGRFAAARKALGTASILNILGPLLNPTQPLRQVIGCSYEDMTEVMAQVIARQNKERVYIVRGQDGLDEVTLTGPTDVVEVRGSKIRKYQIQPSDFGLKPVGLKSIAAESVDRKKKLSLQILKGTCKSAHADLVLVNTALALKLVGRVKTLKQGYKMAQAELVSGRVYDYFKTYQDRSCRLHKLTEIVGHKYGEVGELRSTLSTGSKFRSSLSQPKTIEGRPLKSGKLKKSTKDFKAALKSAGLSVIAEVKQSSPSRGLIVKKGFDPVKMARAYEQSGASAISVLCDARYFQGSFDYLQKVSKSVKIPVLCKEFIVDASQVLKARAKGADAILLLANVLTPEQIESFVALARKYDMDALVEVREAEELTQVLEHTSADIIGINNRDLTKFKTNLNQTAKLLKTIDSERLQNLVIVSESGIEKPADIKVLPKRVDAILVGTSVVNAPEKVADLVGAKPQVKICGVGDEKVLAHCRDSGIDLVGLNFVPESSRFIECKEAAQILQSFDRGRLKVGGVFQDQSPRKINKIVRELHLDFVQLSGEESVEILDTIQVRVLKGCRLQTKADIARARAFYKAGATIVLESSAPGKGQAIDKSLLKLVNFPFILAGGLTPQVVSKTKRSSFCIGFDVASGVELKGVKSAKLITQFLKNSS